MIPQIKNHRSVRSFSTKPIPQDAMNEMLTAATRASTVGTMQLYSIVVITDEQIRKQLAPLHFNQPMLQNAPAIVTFCADVNRFELWCKQRNADPHYHNFIWYVNAAIDTLLASQNFALEAENQGLGICYLGTTLYTADKIIETLNLPRGVVPITTIAVGYPQDSDAQNLSALTPRLPLEAVVHYDKYEDYSEKSIDELWATTEGSEQTQALIKENGLDNLAQIFTQRRYKREDNELFTEKYLDVLRAQGFMTK